MPRCHGQLSSGLRCSRKVKIEADEDQNDLYPHSLCQTHYEKASYQRRGEPVTDKKHILVFYSDGEGPQKTPMIFPSWMGKPRMISFGEEDKPVKIIPLDDDPTGKKQLCFFHQYDTKPWEILSPMFEKTTQLKAWGKKNNKKMDFRGGNKGVVLAIYADVHWTVNEKNPEEAIIPETSDEEEEEEEEEEEGFGETSGEEEDED